MSTINDDILRRASAYREAQEFILRFLKETKDSDDPQIQAWRSELRGILLPSRGFSDYQRTAELRQNDCEAA